MQRSSEYHQKHFMSRSRWLVQNPHMLVVNIDALQTEWQSVMSAVVGEQKPVAVVSELDKGSCLEGILLPVEYEEQYRRCYQDRDTPVQLSFAQAGLPRCTEAFGMDEVHDVETGHRFLFADVTMTTDLHVNEQGKACLATQAGYHKTLYDAGL